MNHNRFTLPIPLRSVFMRFQHEESGSSLVYAAGTLLVLLFLSGLALDGSNAYLQRRRMQTAADAAALAGARSLALEQTIADVEAEITDMTNLNGANAPETTATFLEDNKQVAVRVETTFDTYFAGLMGFPEVTVSAVAQAGYEPVTSPPPDKLYPPLVTCDCVEDEEQEIILTPPVSYYCVDNTYQTDLDVSYSIWLQGLDPTYHGSGNLPEWHYAVEADTGTMEEFPDGTARIQGTVRNQDNEGFFVDFYLTGRTSSPPPDSPKLPWYSVGTDDWYYYTGLSGTLTGLVGGRYEGAVLSISGYGPAFQIGQGANMWDPYSTGAAAWFGIQVTQQPITGLVLEPVTIGDININLNLCGDTGSVTGTEEETETCEFAWADWNGGSSSQSELADNLRNPGNSGSWNIGEWVPAGPPANGSLSLQVQSALSDLVGQDMLIPLYDGSVDDDTQHLICGFASMVVNELNLSEGVTQLSVEFKPAVVRSGATDEAAVDYGVRDVQMYQ